MLELIVNIFRFCVYCLETRVQSVASSLSHPPYLNTYMFAFTQGRQLPSQLWTSCVQQWGVPENQRTSRPTVLQEGPYFITAFSLIKWIRTSINLTYHTWKRCRCWRHTFSTPSLKTASTGKWTITHVWRSALVQRCRGMMSHPTLCPWEYIIIQWTWCQFSFFFPSL